MVYAEFSGDQFVIRKQLFCDPMTVPHPFHKPELVLTNHPIDEPPSRGSTSASAKGGKSDPDQPHE